MSCKKSPVICPYCGAEMNIMDDGTSLFGKNAIKLYWYKCSNEDCEREGPTRETAEEAYKAAVALCEKKNRVLTLEELQAYTGYAWYEGDHKWYHSSFDYPVWIEDGKYNYEGNLYDIPDEVTGRFWLRKPTKEESEAVEWLPEKKEEGDDE